MNRDEKILEALNYLEFDESEFENIDVKLDDLEIKNLKKEYKKRILNSRNPYKLNLKKIVGGLISIVLIGVTAVSIPVIAKNIELSTVFYNELNSDEGYLYYENAIGKSINIDGLNYELSYLQIDQGNLATVKFLVSSNEEISEETLNEINAKGWFKENYKYGKEDGEINRIGKNKFEVVFKSLVNGNTIEDIFFMNLSLKNKQDKISIRLKLNDDNNILAYENLQGKTLISGMYNIQVSEIKKIDSGTKVNLKVTGENKYDSDLRELTYILYIDNREYILGTEINENERIISGISYSNLDKNKNFKGYTLELEEFISKEDLNYENISEDSEVKIKIYDGKDYIGEIE